MFFNRNLMNSIKLQDYPSNNKWFYYESVDKDIKKFNLFPIFPCKVPWDFNKKEKCDNIIKNWQITFQASELKGNHFLNLLDNELCTIKPSYTKRGPQIKYVTNFIQLVSPQQED